MAKKNKKALLIGGVALAALYFLNKNKNVEEFAQPTKQQIKPQAVNTPVTTMAQAKPQLLNPVNNTLNNLTNLVKPATPTRQQAPQKLKQSLINTSALKRTQLTGFNDYIL